MSAALDTHAIIAARNLHPLRAFPSLTDIKSELQAWLNEAVASIGGASIDAALERPRQPEHGDYSSNVAMQLAKTLKRNPREIAAALIAALRASPSVDRVEAAGAGFLNIHLAPAVRASAVRAILVQ